MSLNARFARSKPIVIPSSMDASSGDLTATTLALDAVGGRPHHRWETTTFVGALRLGGMPAPMVSDGPITGPSFLAYVQQVLAPTLDQRGR